MGAPIDYVVFDLGGVVFRWTDALPGLAKLIGAPEGIDAAEFTAAYSAPRSEYDRTPDAHAYWTEVARACGAPAPTLAASAELTAVDIAGWSHSDPSMLQLIDDIHATGIGLAVLSNAPATMGDHVRSRQWAHAFDHIVMSGEIGLMKPDAEIYEYLLSELQAPASRVIFTDDLAANIDGAARAGINGLQFTGADPLRQQLIAMGLSLEQR